MIDLPTIDAALSAIELLQKMGNTQPQFEKARLALNAEKAVRQQRNDEPTPIERGKRR